MDMYERLLLQKIAELEANRVDAMVNGEISNFAEHKGYVQALRNVKALCEEVRQQMTQEQ